MRSIYVSDDSITYVSEIDWLWLVGFTWHRDKWNYVYRNYKCIHKFLHLDVL